MRRPRLDLNLLVALRLLLNERNVTRAAEAMHLSQPAMSATLARLREYFDDALIAPVGRRMELTPLGRSLVEPINDLLVRIDATLDISPTFDPATSQRRFALVASDYVFNVLLRPVIAELARVAPDIGLEVSAANDRCAARLASGEVDLLLVPERFASREHPSVALFEDDHVLVVDADNRAVGDSIDLPGFLACRHVVYEHEGRSYFDAWFERQELGRRRVDVVVYGFQQVAQVVAGTSRVAVMLSRLAGPLLDRLPLRSVELGFGPPPMAVVMQWHRHRELDPGLQWLRRSIVAATPPT